MHFEFDPDKSAANKAKHGVDFDQAQELWADPNRLLIEARSVTEPRSALIGTMGDKVWVAIFTIRNERVRLISVRRAREKELELYEDDLGS
ncbi:MAG TPA: BrnT family toxin [Devosia sp.]|jgi:hypothetical protein|nr:BrnT family toxin [Devosia sp.]